MKILRRKRFISCAIITKSKLNKDVGYINKRLQTVVYKDEEYYIERKMFAVTITNCIENLPFEDVEHVNYSLL